MSEYCKNCKELQREIEKAKEENTRLFSAGIELNESREFFREKFWNADKSRDSWREQAEHYKQALDEINILAGKIISNDDQPACVFDEECPLNGGTGFDNHCNETCPFVSAKQILDIISEAKGADNHG